MKGRQESRHTRPDQDHNSQQPVRRVVFNIFCHHERSQGTFKKCDSAARFSKQVNGSGSERLDESSFSRHALFVVECDGDTIFDGKARRFMDSGGTRIQPDLGPFPAIVLPAGSLANGHRRIDSWLELRDSIVHGSCYLYTELP